MGRLPKGMAQTLGGEGIVLRDEGIPCSVTLRDFRSPGRIHRYRKTLFAGSLVVTQLRFAAFAFSRAMVNLPLGDPRLNLLNILPFRGRFPCLKKKGDRPLPPANLLGDFAGGGMLCAMGILLALFERERSGKGQVVDAAMLDGAAYLTAMFHGMLAHHLMTLDIGTNPLDSGAPFYQTYETKDGRYMAVGAIEQRFYAELLKGLELAPETLPHQFDKKQWPQMIERLKEVFKTKTQNEWTAVFHGKDACVSSALNLDEVADYPHNRQRDIIVNIDGIPQPSPAPKLSRTPGKAIKAKGAEPARGANTREILMELGYEKEEIAAQNFFEKDWVE